MRILKVKIVENIRNPKPIERNIVLEHVCEFGRDLSVEVNPTIETNESGMTLVWLIGRNEPLRILMKCVEFEKIMNKV